MTLPDDQIDPREARLRAGSATTPMRPSFRSTRWPSPPSRPAPPPRAARPADRVGIPCEPRLLGARRRCARCRPRGRRHRRLRRARAGTSRIGSGHRNGRPRWGPVQPGGARGANDHWEGAAGHRIATVELTSSASERCALPLAARVLLVGDGATLLASDLLAWTTLTLASGEVLHTLVQDSNYCGTAAQEPATLVFDFGADVGRVTATPATDGLSGVPDCIGPGSPARSRCSPGRADPAPSTSRLEPHMT